MRGRFDDGFSAIDRKFLEKIHFLLFGRVITNKGCGNCYRDAFLIIYTHLKKIKTMPQPSIYKLKPGVVIQFFGNSTVYTNSNLTDETAEKYLAQNTNNKRFFSDLPSNWEERVASRVANRSTEEESSADPEVLTKMTDQLSEKDKELEETKALLEEVRKENEALQKENLQLKESGTVTDADAEQQLANMTLELQTLQAENDTLKEENNSLRNENRALKSANTRLKNNAGVETETPQ